VRSYIGERDHAGRPTVWVVDESPRPEVGEIGDLLSDIKALVDPARGAGDRPDSAAVMARKHELLARIEADHPPRRPLDHVEVHSPDGFEWGYAGNGPADLAHAVLADHLGVEPGEAGRLAFRDQVVAALPTDRFRLPAAEVGAWVAAHRDLVERELFLDPPATGTEQAWSVADRQPGTDGADPDLDPAMASTLVAACESAWRDIQSHHPELPDAVMVLGTGVERGRLVKLGHWWGGQWVADGQTRGEVLLAGEALHLEPGRVFEVLLHEAAHGFNAARGVKDTSRGGRYHNQRFAETAKAMLLRVRAMPPYGLATTDLTPAALERYDTTVSRLGDAMRIARQLRAGLRVGAEGGEIEGTLGGPGGGREGGDRQGRGGPVAASCGCGRKMRMAPSVLVAGPVLCGLCGTDFSTGAERRRPGNEARPSDGTREERGAAEAVVDRSFLTRRQAAIAAVPETDAGHDDAVARVLDRQRARIEAALRSATNPADPVMRPLVERHDRLQRLLSESLASGFDTHVAAASDAQLEGITDLAAADRGAGDHAALRRWYERYGTLQEEPIPAASAADAARRERLARALLKADGSLHGPAVTTLGGGELRAGDRVLPTLDHGDLPAGTPGTIEGVDPDSGTIDIDFPTWGRLRTSLADGLARDLRHDYTEIRTPADQPELELSGPGVEL
jgi:hypothetical protein